jgi:predicted Rossmann fold flavoprotein
VIYDSIVLGAGAAGLYCAQIAGRRGRSVLVLERNSEPGAKILISGGGRCNFTNIACAPDRFVSANPDFARSALSRHTPEDFVALVRQHGIQFYEKTLGQLFCEGDGSARKIVRMLLDECAAGGVRVALGQDVAAVTRGETFRVETNKGAFEGRTLVIASGGLSIPKLGASDLAYRLAKQFGLAATPTRPGLVPLTFSGDDLAWMRSLSGLSTPVTAHADGPAFPEAALFTHRGLSGPAILQASSYWREGEAIVIDWAPDHGADFLIARKRAQPKIQIKTALSEAMPARLAAALAQTLPVGALADLKDQMLREAGARLKAWPILPAGTEGYAKAEVTVGGVATSALSQKTMETRSAPGLFVIGEAVDVTGWLGGYNFQWAWASGWAAGNAI